MFFKNILKQLSKREIINQEFKGKKALMYVTRLEAAFLKISSMINAHKDLNKIFEVIAQESLHCLKADRSTIFFVDEKNENLETHFIYAFNPLYGQVGLNEEKEVAYKAFQQNSPVLLRQPEDFSGFFQYRGKESKITSLMSIPIPPQGKMKGVLSAVLINEKYSFNEKSLQFFSSFAYHVSIAIKMAHLVEEVCKTKTRLATYESYLDDILKKLQKLSDKEPQSTDKHIVK